MRKLALFQNGYSRSVAILIVLLLSFQSAVAQDNASMDSDSSIVGKNMICYELSITKGTVIENIQARSIFLDRNKFDLNDLNSFYTAIQNWTEYHSTHEESIKIRKPEVGSKFDQYPIKILDSSLIGLLMRCRVYKINFRGTFSKEEYDYMYIYFESTTDSTIFMSEYKSIKSIHGIHLMVNLTPNDVLGIVQSNSSNQMKIDTCGNATPHLGSVGKSK